MQFICEVCDKTFQHKSSYVRHMRDHKDGKRFKCDECDEGFKRHYHLDRHKLTHTKTSFPCNWCNTTFKRDDKLKEHRSNCNGIEDMCFVETDSGFGRRIVDCRIQNRLPGDVGYVIGRLAHKIEVKVKEYLETNPGVKFNLWVECEFVNPHGDSCVRNLKTSLATAMRSCNVAQIVQDKIEKLVNECEECVIKGSGWSYNRLLNIELRLNKYAPV